MKAIIAGLAALLALAICTSADAAPTQQCLWWHGFTDVRHKSEIPPLLRKAVDEGLMVIIRGAARKGNLWILNIEGCARCPASQILTQAYLVSDDGQSATEVLPIDQALPACTDCPVPDGFTAVEDDAPKPLIQEFGRSAWPGEWLMPEEPGITEEAGLLLFWKKDRDWIAAVERRGSPISEIRAYRISRDGAMASRIGLPVRRAFKSDYCSAATRDAQ
jgi:hypothetical protein